MADTNVMVGEATFRKLQEMAEWLGLSVEETLQRTIDDQYGRKFWDAVNRGYAALRAEPAMWAAVEAERREWDGTLMDGLDPAEIWGDDGKPLPGSERKQVS